MKTLALTLAAALLCGTLHAANPTDALQGILKNGEPAAPSIRLDGALQERMLDMTTDQDGNVYVVGSFSSPQMDVEAFIDDSTNLDGTVTSLGKRSVRNVGAEDIFVAKCEPNGRVVWLRSAGGPGADYATGVQVDSKGNVFITGTFSGTANIGGTTLSATLQTVTGDGRVSNGGVQVASDLFVAMLQSNGTWRWAKRLEYALTNVGTTADDFIKIDFATRNKASTGAPQDYIRDDGDPFQSQSNLTYPDAKAWGWVLPINGYTTPVTNPGGMEGNVQPYENSFIKTNSLAWRINVPAGTYRITARGGAATELGNYHTVVVTSETGARDLIRSNRMGSGFFDGQVTVTLANPGYIVLADGPQARDNRLSYVTLRREARVPTSIGVSGSFGITSGTSLQPGKALVMSKDGLDLFIKGRFVDGQNLNGEAGASTEIYLQPKSGEPFLIDQDSTSFTAGGNAFVARLRLENEVVDRNAPASWVWDWLTPFAERSGTSVSIGDLALDDLDDVIVGGTWKGYVTGGGHSVMSTFFDPPNPLAPDNGFVFRLRRSDGRRTSFNWIQGQNGQTLAPTMTVDSVEAMQDGTIYVQGNFNAAGSTPVAHDWGITPARATPSTEVQFRVGANRQMFVAKIDELGEFAWISRPTGTSDCAGYGMAIDPTGGVVVTGGLSDGPATFNTTNRFIIGGITGGEVLPFIGKLQEDSTGAPQWVQVVQEFATDGTTPRHHGSLTSVGANGTVWWLISSGRFSSLNRDLNGNGPDAANDFGSEYFLGKRTGTNRAFDRTQFYGGILLAADLSLTKPVIQNSTGYYTGQEIPAPAGAALDAGGRPLQPDIDVSSVPGADPNQFFLWDSFSRRLLAVSPIVKATIRWKLTSDVLDLRRLNIDVACRWPTASDPAGALQRHVIGGSGIPEPEVDLNYGSTTHGFASVLYTTAGAVMQNSTLRVNKRGFSALLYVEGAASELGRKPVQIQAVQHVPWQELVGPDQAVTIGQEITDPDHDDPVLNGYLVNVKSRVDANGPTAAHQRATRTGPIIPVNTDEAPEDDDLVILWYARNARNGVSWPSKAVRYKAQWPTNPERIVITSSQGSDVRIPATGGDIYPQEALLPPKFQSLEIYHQPDKAKPGYNPNEEHALVEVSQTRSSSSVYALRNDLNHRNTTTSDPYVLVRYQDGTADLRWKMKVYRVELTGGYSSGPNSVSFNFNSYTAVAGTRVQPPFPMSILGDHPNTVGRGRPYWQDKNGGVWARAEGTLIAGYWYPLRPDFWVDRDGDGTADAVTGVPWLEFVTPAQAPQNATAALGDPVELRYTITWPNNVPELLVGDTLSRAKNGLPDLRNWASAELIFDEAQPDLLNPIVTSTDRRDSRATSARLLDAVSPRAVPFTTSDSGGLLVNNGGQPIKVSFAAAGKRQLTDLPAHLKLRVRFNPTAFSGNGGLEFAGYDVDDPTGASPVLLNVMSDKERDAMLALDDPASGPTSNSQWDRAVRALYVLTRNPNGLDLNGDSFVDDALLYGLLPPAGNLPELRLQQVLGGAALTAGLGKGVGYVTLAQNNAPGIDSPITLAVIRVVPPQVRGSIDVIYSDNVFDERVVLRHSPDFAGDPSNLFFEWYYREAPGGPAPTTTPDLDKSWELIASGLGVNDIAIKGSGLRSLSDGWFYVCYRGYSVGGLNASTFSGFAGDRSATPAAPIPAFVKGWIKRVTEGINPFDQRTTDFHSSPTQTYVSMIEQAGARYEGDVAFNPAADNVNSLGLIELYQTVLNRGLSLSINGTPSQTTTGVNNALLYAASRVSDFYSLLGNEAYGDAQDPTIGFNVATGNDFGTLSSSVFAFQNQLPSLIDEELALLRGRDDTGAGVAAVPVYNRLFWNFTSGLEGEPAYVLNYNITDQNGDGFINEKDAAKLYPQGHGDAWGHYLTATKAYYKLMRHPSFDWVPRSETTSVAGVAINVDYLDEVKFARASAAKAKAGKEIVSLTYRDSYVADPQGQWQGYKDADSERAWGVDEWARRAGQAALFDWAIGNALLPENSNKQGLEKIDRETVFELRQLSSETYEIQNIVDAADRGLNPLGLAGDTIPFDIDPARVVDSAPETHFEQVLGRAQTAVDNALSVYSFANSATERIRALQLSANDFSQQAKDQDRNFKNRLIEIYGYPHEGDIGAGRTYPAGYDGPDLYKWMYVDVAEFTDELVPAPTATVEAYFRPLNLGSDLNEILLGHFYPEDLADPSTLLDDGPQNTKQESLPLLDISAPGAAGWAFQKTTEMGIRRARGRLQQSIGRLVSSQIAFKRALGDYESYVQQIADAAKTFEAQRGVALETIRIRQMNIEQVRTLDAAIADAQITANVLNNTRDSVLSFAETVVEFIPTNAPTAGASVSPGSTATAPVKGAVLTAAWIAGSALGGVANGFENKATNIASIKEWMGLKNELSIETFNLESGLEQQLQAIQQLLRSEPDQRLNVFLRKRDVEDAAAEVRAIQAEGERLMEERTIYRQKVAGPIQSLRYQDISFRNFRNDALQKYRASFDLAARYVYLAARAYDYETCLPGEENAAGQVFLTNIVRQRALGQFIDGKPVSGVNGLSDPMARMQQNFSVLKGQLGFNNPQTETGRFSLRTEFLRIKADAASNETWREALARFRVADLWQLAEFRRFCRPFAPESAGPQPGLVIPFNTDVTFGQNFFGWPLAGGDSSYDSSNFATKIRSVGVWFENYNGRGLSVTPRVYLVPAGLDIMRSPDSDSFATREFAVLDQQLPVPFPLGNRDLANPAWIPQLDSLDGQLFGERRFNRFRAYHDGGFSLSEMTSDSRLIGRSVWNSRWLLIIPGGTFLNDGTDGIETFIYGQKIPGAERQRDGNGVSDIKLFFQTYAYPGR